MHYFDLIINKDLSLMDCLTLFVTTFSVENSYFSHCSIIHLSSEIL